MVNGIYVYWLKLKCLHLFSVKCGTTTAGNSYSIEGVQVKSFAVTESTHAPDDRAPVVLIFRQVTFYNLWPTADLGNNIHAWSQKLHLMYWEQVSLCRWRVFPHPSLLVSLEEGVSWIWSRRVGKQRSEGSRDFQLIPAFFLWLPDGSQMFWKQFLPLYLLTFIPLSSLSRSVTTYTAPPSVCPSPFFFLLPVGITPFTSTHLTLSNSNPHQHSSNKLSSPHNCNPFLSSFPVMFLSFFFLDSLVFTLHCKFWLKFKILTLAYISLRLSSSAVHVN